MLSQHEESDTYKITIGEKTHNYIVRPPSTTITWPVNKGRSPVPETPLLTSANLVRSGRLAHRRLLNVALDHLRIVRQPARQHRGREATALTAHAAGAKTHGPEIFVRQLPAALLAA